MRMVYGPPGSGKTYWVESQDCVEVFDGDGRPELINNVGTIFSTTARTRDDALMAVAKYIGQSWVPSLKLDIYRAEKPEGAAYPEAPVLEALNVEAPVTGRPPRTALYLRASEPVVEGVLVEIDSSEC